MSAPFTPSGRYRAKQCPPSTFLPRPAVRAPAGRPAARGTGYHTFTVRAGAVGYVAALDEVPHDAEHRSLCEACDPLTLPIDWTTARQEVAFSYDASTDTARELVGVTDRAYESLGPLGPSEIPGSIDILEDDAALIEVTGGLIVSDIKTGWWSASYRPQIRTYALTAARARGVDSAMTRVIYIEERTGEARIVSEEMDAWALEAEALAIRTELADIAASRSVWEQTGVAHTHPGEWCKYCEARPQCPEYELPGRELASVADGGGPVALLDQVRAELATEDGRARWWYFVERAPVLLAAISDVVKAAAPFELPDGREVRKSGRVTRRVVSATDVRDELVAMGRADVVAAAFTFEVVTQMHTSITALEAALGGGKRARPVIERLIGHGIAAEASETVGAFAPERIKGKR